MSVNERLVEWLISQAGYPSDPPQNTSGCNYCTLHVLNVALRPLEVDKAPLVNEPKLKTS